MNLSEKIWESLDWMQLAQDKDWCRAFVNTVMNIWFP
jgi:hypothetical protein